MSNLANILTLTRLALAPVLLAIAAGGQRRAFLVVLGLSLLTDALDGPVARRTNRVSAHGARLDSIADLATWAVLPVCVWWLWPAIVIEQASHIGIAVLALLAPLACGWLRFGCLPSYHTRGAKLAALLMAGGVTVLLTDGPPWPFQFSVALLAVTAAEEIAITCVLPGPVSDVPCLWHAVRLRARRARDQLPARALASARPSRSSTKYSNTPPPMNNTITDRMA